MGSKSPTLPDYGQMSRDAVIANLTTFPQTYMTNAQASLGTGRFQGLGDAATAGVVSNQMAQALLDIQRNYAPGFIRQRLAELQAADPEGYAARHQLFEGILQQADQQPNRPLAQNLQDQIMQTLHDSGHLDNRQLQEVQQDVRGGQVARGNYLGNAATEQEAAATVSAEDQARQAAQQSALQFLQSGVSPQDVAYRRLQQSMGNLSNFVNGATPSAEFGSLSGAGNGAAPTATFSSNPASVDTNAPAGWGQNALQIYGGQINWAQQQVNPYTAGLSILAGGAGTAGNLGWSPWGTPNGNAWGTSPNLSAADINIGNTLPNYNPGQPTGP